MLTLNDIRKGVLLVLEGEPYEVVAAEFLRKQQRRPVMRTTLRNVRTGQTRAHSFQQSDKVPEAEVERRAVQFLFGEGERFTFMDMGTYEQVELTRGQVGAYAPYLVEGQAADIVFFTGAPVSLTLPIKIDRRVISAPPGVRGDSSTNVMKEVVVEGGARVKAPLFIQEGDVIRLDTRSGAYVERVQGS